jgi:hypothetical protein
LAFRAPVDAAGSLIEKRVLDCRKDAAMIKRGSFQLHRIPLALAVALAEFCLPLARAQTFSISAPAVTTDSAGAGLIQFTVSGIPFDGTLIIGCQYAGDGTLQAQDRLPVCGAGPVVGFGVTAGQTITKTISLVPWGTPMPLSTRGAPHNTHRMLASGFLFAGVLFLGLGFPGRRGRQQFFFLLVGALAVASSISACGGGSTPPGGTYPYTLTATLTSTSPAILTAATTATVKVTIP